MEKNLEYAAAAIFSAEKMCERDYLGCSAVCLTDKHFYCLLKSGGDHQYASVSLARCEVA